MVIHFWYEHRIRVGCVLAGSSRHRRYPSRRDLGKKWDHKLCSSAVGPQTSSWWQGIIDIVNCLLISGHLRLLLGSGRPVPCTSDLFYPCFIPFRNIRFCIPFSKTPCRAREFGVCVQLECFSHNCPIIEWCVHNFGRKTNKNRTTCAHRDPAFASRLDRVIRQITRCFQSMYLGCHRRPSLKAVPPALTNSFLHQGSGLVLL